jgi:two-component system, NtrC family, C4-dicarboxylate transport response regulator DctD
MTAKHVIIVDDDDMVRFSCRQTLQLAGFEATSVASAEEALAILGRDFPGVVLSDIRMPGLDGFELLARIRLIDPELPVIHLTGHGDIGMAVEAMREGAYDFLQKPYNTEILTDVIRRALEKRDLVLENRRLRRALAGADAIERLLIGRGSRMTEIRRTIADLASTDADILVIGETGTGKEQVARALHEASERRKRHFVAVNCGAVPESVFESEMFGHEPGAFTGAVKRRIGKIEHANGGTLLLDEIESMPLALQVKLLRVVQERRLERLGGNDLIEVDCRIVAATKEDLLAASKAGRFREDLFYRLNVVTIELPPLRERREDIPALFEHFVGAAAARYRRAPPDISPALSRSLASRDWPGNARELRNEADRFVLGFSRGSPSAREAPATLPDIIDEVEREIISQALREANNQVTAAAVALGIPRKTLHDKMKRLGLAP